MDKKVFKLLFVVSRYNPEVSASGSLVANLVDEFARSHEVTVLTGTNLNSKTEIVDQKRIIRIKDNKKKQNNFFDKVKKVVSCTAYNKKKINEIVNVLEDYLEHEAFDFVIPVTYNEIIACIILKRKKKEIKLVPFLLEIFLNFCYFGEADIFSKIRDLKNKKLMNELLCESECIIALPAIYETIKKIEKREDKLLKVEHPMVINNISNVINNEISLVYTGGLDRVNRNPVGALKLLSMALEKSSFKIKFFAYGNCEDLLKDYDAKYKSFSYYGAVSPEEAKNALSEASVVITIGNKNKNLIPSKLFDVVSTGNPIVHFYYSEDDPYFTYLKRYPYVLFIGIENLNLANESNKIIEFINLYGKKKVNFDEIENQFAECLPSYVASQILNFLKVTK